MGRGHTLEDIMTNTPCIPSRASVSGAPPPHPDHASDASTMTSVVSYPRRCPEWGSNAFRGNCDGTLFRDLVLRYQATSVADPMMGSGTTKDVIRSLNRTRSQPIGYWGGDLSLGFDLTRHPLPGKFDFVWVHPPYWNIIRYSDHANDLSTEPDYQTFLALLELCLFRCFAALVPQGRLAVLVGDVRRKGRYYPLGRDLMNLDRHLGRLASVIIKVQHNCASDRISYAPMADVPIQHEYCAVFQKPS